MFDKKNRKKILDGLIDLDGIGQIQLDSIESFFSKSINIEIIKRLINELKINNFKTQNQKGKFSNKTIMFTGGFEKMSRSEAKSLVEKKMEGKCLELFQKKLNILVIGNSKPTKRKIDKAKQLNIEVIKENDWYKLLDL